MTGRGDAAAPKEVDPVALKKQHSIVYEENTSDIKDACPQLLQVMSTGTGPLTRQEASFLIWYHALDGLDKQAELVQAGAAAVCLNILDPSTAATPVERTCAAGILMALCSDEDSAEVLARARTSHGSMAVALHSLLLDTRDVIRLYAARCLHLLAKHAPAKSILLRSMDNCYGPDNLKLYVNMLMHSQECHTLAELTAFLAVTSDKRPDLLGELSAGKVLEALLVVLQTHKADSVASHSLHLLELLLQDRAVWPRIVSQGAIELLCDVLGPPPVTLLEWEGRLYRSLIDPAWGADQQQKRHELLQLQQQLKSMSLSEQLKGDRQHVRAGTATSETVRPRSTARPGGVAGRNAAGKDDTQGTQAALQEDQLVAAIQRLKEQVVEQESGPPRMRGHLLSTNHAGLKWHSIVSMQTYAHASACLYILAQEPDHMHRMSARLAAPRLCAVLKHVLAAGDGIPGKKSKSKKKGLSLTADQTVLLSHVTGCLKFLSLVNANKYRIARGGIIKPLVSIYVECGHTLLRRNAQVILSQMALLAENGQVLLESNLPEEFLVPRPMRLLQEEVDELLVEYPQSGLKFVPSATTKESDSARSKASERLAEATA